MSADLGNTSVISPIDANNGSGTMPSFLGSAAPSTLDDASRALQGAVAREWENRSYPTATGTAPAFVVTYTVAPAALRSGQTYTFTAHAAAVGTDTLNPNTLGPKGIKKVVAGTKTATAANDWYAGDKISCVYDGTDMVWSNTAANTAASLALYAPLASANTFTAAQTIQSTDAGAGVAPILALDRFSASPAAADILATLRYIGRDDGGNSTNYAAVYADIVDPTDGSEDGKLNLQTIIAGTSATRLSLGAGAFTPNATGGDKGIDTINASEYYKNGSPLGGMTLLATIATTSGTAGSATGLNPSLYRKYYIEIDGISLTASSNPIQISLSGDGGTNYGTALTISANSGGAVNTFDGWLELGNINSTRRFGCTIGAGQVIDQTGATANVGPVLGGLALGKAATGAGNPVDAIKISTTGTFDAGAFRVYGER